METTITTDPLLDEVEAYLTRTGVTGFNFGLAALNDSGFVTTLRRGREPRRKTRARVLQFMADNPSGLFKPDR